jgi:kynurenine formamidase
MKATIQTKTNSFKVDLLQPIDISMHLGASKKNVSAWYLGAPKIAPAQIGDWIGSVQHGASVNFNTIEFNPHAHGTHTECVGHITKEFYSVNQSLKQFFFLSELITIAPTRSKTDFVISKKQLQFALAGKRPESIIIRTLPNTSEKLSQQYSNTNPPYFLEEAALYLRSIGVKHWLVDLPSVDKEKDEGQLLAHHAFWNTSGNIRLDATITEFIFVPNHVADGSYLLNLQIASFENDASPSKPILYKITD